MERRTCIVRKYHVVELIIIMSLSRKLVLMVDMHNMMQDSLLIFWLNAMS